MPDAGNPPENTDAAATADAAASADAAVSADEPGRASVLGSDPVGTPRLTEATPADFDLAREALHDITPESTIGAPAGFIDEGGGVVTVYFETTLTGYVGWRWTVSIAHVDGSDPSVLETELTPGDAALLSPEWVPWVDRLAEHHAGEDAARVAAGEAAVGESDDGDSGDDRDDDDSDDDDDDSDDDRDDDYDDDDSDDRDDDDSDDRDYDRDDDDDEDDDDDFGDDVDDDIDDEDDDIDDLDESDKSR